jgi:transcriptional regulator with XRE-family HTH domain
MTIAERIIQLRTKKGYSTNKLAQLSTIGQATLREIEIGKKSPNIVTLEKICKALEISLADFFSDGVSTSLNTNNDIDLSDDIKKELELVKEFVLYKHGIRNKKLE